jgi:threonine 3-dehydrogenase
MSWTASLAELGGSAMKALVKSKSERGLWLEEIPEPAVGINDVLVRVHKTGICGTDVHIYQWDEWAQKTIPVPMAIGHEFVGEIVAVGSNVNDFFPGDIVSGEGHLVCGRCRNCLAGRRHLCAYAQGVGVNRPGAFAELISLPMTNIWRHHAGIDHEVAAIFDPFGNAVHGAFVSSAWRRRSHHRRGTDRADGDSGGEIRWSASRGGDGSESVPP